MIRILLVGGSGFVGQAVSRVLAERPDRPDLRVRWTVHSSRPDARPRDEVRRVDLADPRTLRGITSGTDVAIHLGHRLAGSPAELAAVNDLGARALAEDAGAHAVRLVALSTASVYGAGPWRGDEIHDLPECPASTVSASRAAGDRWVLTGGGVVVRPHFVLGRGDRWVMPRAAALVARFGWIQGMPARHSVIDVDRLARRIVGVALDEAWPAAAPGGVLLAAAGQPSDLREEIDRHLRTTGRRAAPVDMSLGEALEAARSAGDRQSEHDLNLLTTDHHLSCSCTVPAAAGAGPEGMTEGVHRP